MTTVGQVTRFAVVGVVNTANYYLAYLAINAALPYLAAHLLAYGYAMVVSFFLNVYFTYRTTPTWKKFLLFPLSNLTHFVVITAGVYLLVGVVGWDAQLAPLVAATAAVPVTFLVSRTILLQPGGSLNPVPQPPSDRSAA